MAWRTFSDWRAKSFGDFAIQLCVWDCAYKDSISICERREGDRHKHCLGMGEGRHLCSAIALGTPQLPAWLEGFIFLRKFIRLELDINFWAIFIFFLPPDMSASIMIIFSADMIIPRFCDLSSRHLQWTLWPKLGRNLNISASTNIALATENWLPFNSKRGKQMFEQGVMWVYWRVWGLVSTRRHFWPERSLITLLSNTGRYHLPTSVFVLLSIFLSLSSSSLQIVKFLCLNVLLTKRSWEFHPIVDWL